MISVRLDYQRKRKPFAVADAILLSAAVVATLLCGLYYYSLSSDFAVWESRLKQSEQVSVRHSKTLSPEAEVDFKRATEVLRQLTLPWEELFLAVESSSTPQVTLLGMEPDMEKHVINISCESRDIGSMLSFMKRLEARQEFNSVYLQSHQIQERDPERPVRFSLIAFWRAAA